MPNLGKKAVTQYFVIRLRVRLYILQLLKALISIFIVTISLYFFSCIKRCVVSSVANIIYDSLLLNITNENYNNHWKQRRRKWRLEKLKTKKNTYFILTPTSYLRFKFGLQIVHTNWFDRQGAKDLRFTVEKTVCATNYFLSCMHYILTN